MKKPYLKNTQQGMTLIEILIAMMLGTFLLAGVIQVFLSSKQSYRMQENMSRMQENGRFAMEFISRDIRMAGYFGCTGSTGSIENDLKDQSNAGWDITAPLTGYNNIDSSFSVFSNVVVGTDVVVMRGLSGASSPLVNPYTQGAQMFVDPVFNSDCPSASANTCHEGDILMVTDCTQGTIFQATQTTLSNAGGSASINLVHSGNNTFTPGNSSPTFTNSYGQGAMIARLNTFGYFIRLNSANQPSLYRSRLVMTGNISNALVAEELIEGIENMQILYGEDTDSDGTPNHYVAAGTATLNMNQVVSIRVSLLVTSIDDNLIAQPRAYTYNGVSTTPTDRRIRRVFSSTITIRNRL